SAGVFKTGKPMCHGKPCHTWDPCSRLSVDARLVHTDRGEGRPQLDDRGPYPAIREEQIRRTCNHNGALPILVKPAADRGQLIDIPGPYHNVRAATDAPTADPLQGNISLDASWHQPLEIESNATHDQPS